MFVNGMLISIGDVTQQHILGSNTCSLSAFLVYMSVAPYCFILTRHPFFLNTRKIYIPLSRKSQITKKMELQQLSKPQLAI